MAQEQGFEPWHRVTDLQAFQACPFNRLGIPATECLCIISHISEKGSEKNTGYEKKQFSAYLHRNDDTIRKIRKKEL